MRLLAFKNPLQRGRLIQRYKRFFADITLDSGETITAHCPNTGSMKTCGVPGDVVYVSHNPDPKRKLAYTWEYTAIGDGFIGVNTARPNLLVEQALSQNLIPELAGYQSLRREVKYGENSRIDFLLADHSERSNLCYVEVKNVTLLDRDRDLIVFPDAVTARGLKHLHALMQVKQAGNRAVMLYLVNRPDGRDFAAAAHIDPLYSAALIEAQANGVEVLVYRADNRLEGSSIGASVPLI